MILKEHSHCFMIHDIFAIDTHTHINHGAPHDSEMIENITDATLEHILEMAKAAKIDKMFCSTFSSVCANTEIPEENEYLEKLCNSLDCMYQWVVMEPRVDMTFSQAERILKTQKCVGIKLHPGLHNYTLKDYGDKLADFADSFDTTLLIHGGGDEELLRLANEHPRLRFILPHVATVGDVDICARSKHSNVYLDTSGIGSVRNNVIEYAVKRCGSERILFGTDTYAAGFQRGRIEYAMISDKDKENILRYNAERLFGIS